MKSLIFTVVLIISLGSAIAENGNKSNASTNNKNATVSGKIVDIKTGESVAGACVTVLGTDIKVYTDLDGNYFISNLSSGVHTLNVNMISYKTKSEIRLNTSLGSTVDKNIVIEPEF